MKKIARGLRYAFTVMNHPIRGFYDIRFEGQGNPVAATLWLVFLIAMFVVQKQYTGFIFNTNNIREFNVLQEIGNALIPVFLWWMDMIPVKSSSAVKARPIPEIISRKVCSCCVRNKDRMTRSSVATA